MIIRLRGTTSAVYLTCAILGTIALASQPEGPRQQAKHILEATGVRGGLVVHLGCGDGTVTAALRDNGSFLVHGLDCDAEDVTRARRFVQDQGMYGDVSIMRWSDRVLPYAENMVNLLIVEQSPVPSESELMRVLAPGGVAYIRRDGKWTRKVKPRPAEIDEWTHWLHNASGNAVARDSVVGPPRRFQWAAEPLWQRHHDTVPSTTAMVSAAGRLFYISDEAPACLDATVPDKWFLVARDAFNGVLLWKRPIREWGWDQWSTEWRGRFNEPPHLPKRLVAAGDRVYVTLNFNAPLTALDAATGQTVHVYEGTDNTDEILYKDGLLILSLNNERRQPGGKDSPPVKKSVCVLDADSGRVLWKKGDYTGLSGKFNSTDPFGRLELAVGSEQVYLVDHDAILSFDLKSGNPTWRTERPPISEHLIGYGVRMSDMSVLLYQDGVVLFGQPEMKKKRSWHSLPGTVYAYDATKGKQLWKHPYGGWSHNWQPDVFVVDGLVWLFEHADVPMEGHDILDKSGIDYAIIGLDLKTGQLKRRFSTKESFDVGHHHRCYRNKATQRYLLASRRGVEFLDLASGENDLNHWARGACLYGMVPCNGLLYLTPHPCDCYLETKLNGYCALAPRGKTIQTGGVPARRSESFEKGPAFGRVRGGAVESSNDWPSFRSDPRRSGSTHAQVASRIDLAWRTTVGGKLTAPVIAGGKLFVASSDQHRIAALDAGTGDTEWAFTACGRIDSPPTICGDLVLFGSADGWAYCLRRSDGQLVWRRRVAPEDRLVGAFGQLESAWPAHGSVLVQDGVGYLAAGRSSYLDGGIRLYAFDPVTGKVRQQRSLYSPDPNTDKMPPGDKKNIPGTLADILVGDGDSVYMRQERVFGPDDDRSRTFLQATGGLRDADWFNRTQWTVGAVARAQLLVFDDENVYGVQAYPGTGRSAFFGPGQNGYLLFAARQKGPSGNRKSTGQLWGKRVPVRITAMVLAGRNLFVAGPPDVLIEDDPLAAFEGRAGGRLWVVSAADGEALAKYDLQHEPVYDGMAGANHRLYVSARNGEVLCFGPSESGE